MMQLAKNYSWLANLLLFHRAVKARRWTDFPLLNLSPFSKPASALRFTLSGNWEVSGSVSHSWSLPLSPHPNYHQVLSILQSLLPLYNLSLDYHHLLNCFKLAAASSRGNLPSPGSHPINPPHCILPGVVNQNHTSEFATLYFEPFSGSHLIWICCKILLKRENCSIKREWNPEIKQKRKKA